MKKHSGTGRSTQVSQLILAPRVAVYRAFLDPQAVATWLAPDTMKGHVETYEPRADGKFRMSLTYQNAEVVRAARLPKIRIRSRGSSSNLSRTKSRLAHRI